MARTAARDAAFRLLYERELGGEGGLDGFINMTEKSFTEDDLAYIRDIMAGCAKHDEQLDDAVERFAKEWDIDRLSRVDLSLLRLAAYELHHREDIPASVTISEVIELAQIYSSDEAPAFINGLLGAMVRAEHLA